jgi:hypothetical protein
MDGARARTDDPIVQPRWLPFPESVPTDVQQITNENRALSTISRYEAPSGQWVMIRQLHFLAAKGPSYGGAFGHTVVNGVPATLFQLQIAPAGRSVTILGVGWAHPTTGKYVDLQSVGLTQAELLQVAESIS